ncbi:FAD/NAD(P)-binding domain-containing protein [Heliocybe sulcata]|uniref:FAD/NAD(P)-binding domain-containing protein n=1 Tax=Heliocybe sulcata TaxID=5364 RepID=A0A5C3MRS8_9AGAM|nr:FAD/NAD(P)-binding domain-containing protein [Heliocybe sulcata]
MATAISSATSALPAMDKLHLRDTEVAPQSILKGLERLVSGSASSGKPTLPTLEKLGVREIPSDIDVKAIATSWLLSFAKCAQTADADGLLSLLTEDAFWRDLLVMTWDFRIFQSTPAIRSFLNDRLARSKLSSFKLNDATVELQRPWHDIAWIQALFSFEADAGRASGVVRLVPIPTSDGKLTWKAHAVLTNLEELKGFPEKTGPHREPLPNHGKWLEKRQREIDFVDEEPKVLIIGGGQSGLEIAARLKYLNVPSLIVERHPRIGHNWRTRYEALCLHDPVWYDHMPYLPFPPTWPVYTPAMKLADWLESYAHHLELNVWTSSTITKINQDDKTKKWTVVVQRGENGPERTFTVEHLVFALGFGGGEPRRPKYPGMDEFEGKIIHSAQHKTARDHVGKKVVVIGACTSAHDICAEHVEHGVDVTMFQRNPTYIMTTKRGMPLLLGSLYSETAPPTDTADRINASFPNPLMKLMHQRVTRDIAEADKELLDGLQKAGFKLGWGEDGSGFLYLAWKRAGGYYLDVGASQLIIDGKIKLKNDSPIERFTKTGIKFENGSELPADVVITATGYDDPRTAALRLLGDKAADKLRPIWGISEEGEINGAWRDIGIPNLWYMMGNLAMCRFHSKHLALQIKARLEGAWNGDRYSA